MHGPEAKKSTYEASRAPQALHEVLTNPRMRGLFTRYLNTLQNDTEIVRDIFETHKANGQYTQEQITFLNDHFPKFKEHFLLAEEVRYMFDTKEIEQAAKNHEPLRELLALNNGSPQILKRYMEVMAMERPEELRAILDLKRSVNEKRRSIRYKAHERMTQTILKRFKLSNTDFEELKNISNERERRQRFRELVQERVDGLQKAVGWLRGTHTERGIEHAFDTLNQFEKDEVKREIGEHLHAVADVLNGFVRGDHEFMEAIQYARIPGEGREDEGAPEELSDDERWKKNMQRIILGARDLIGDYIKGEASWAWGIASALLTEATGIYNSPNRQETKRNSKKEPKEKSAEEIGREEEKRLEKERFKNPQELYDAVGRQLRENNKKGAWKLVDEYLGLHITRKNDLKRIKSEIEGILIKQKGSSEDALQKLSEALGLFQEERESNNT